MSVFFLCSWEMNRSAEQNKSHENRFAVHAICSALRFISHELRKKTVFQLENEKGRAPGWALCAKWAREGTFLRKQTLKL